MRRRRDGNGRRPCGFIGGRAGRPCRTSSEPCGCSGLLRADRRHGSALVPPDTDVPVEARGEVDGQNSRIAEVQDRRYGLRDARKGHRDVVDRREAPVVLDDVQHADVLIDAEVRRRAKSLTPGLNDTQVRVCERGYRRLYVRFVAGFSRVEVAGGLVRDHWIFLPVRSGWSGRRSGCSPGEGLLRRTLSRKLHPR